MGETDCARGMKFGDCMDAWVGDERCEPGVDWDSGERWTGPSDWIRASPLEPWSLGGPWSERLCCCRFNMARCCRGAWLGELCADPQALVGPRVGLPVLACSSA